MYELSLKGRVAIVTGAGRGMGAAHAHVLAERGASVVVNDLGSSIHGEGSDAGPAETVAREITAAGGKAVANNQSVSTTEGAQSMVALALEQFGRLDIVINNAGFSDQPGWPDTDLDDFNRHLHVHLAGSFNVSRAAWPHFAAQAYGRIVMVTSSAFLGIAGRASYPAAKAGQIGLARSLGLAARAAGIDIKVNLVAPLAHTRLGRHNVKTLDGGEEVQLDPRLVSAAVVYLAHESCPVDGEIFGVGGGKIDRLFIGATKGYTKADLTPEDVRDNWSQVMDTTDFWIPEHAHDHAKDMRDPRPTLQSEE